VAEVVSKGAKSVIESGTSRTLLLADALSTVPPIPNAGPQPPITAPTKLWKYLPLLAAA
jgi:hypothetical protein